MMLVRLLITPFDQASFLDSQAQQSPKGIFNQLESSPRANRGGEDAVCLLALLEFHHWPNLNGAVTDGGNLRGHLYSFVEVFAV